MLVETAAGHATVFGPGEKGRRGRMGHDIPFAIVAHEAQQVLALLRVEIELVNAEEEDRAEVIEIARQKLLAGRDAGALLEEDRGLGDRLRISADDRVVEARLPAEALDRTQGMRDRIVLIAVA